MNPKNNFTCVGTWAIIYTSGNDDQHIQKNIFEVLKDRRGFYADYLGLQLRIEDGDFPNATAWCLIDKTGYTS